jgi:PhzF family phenazine biosynthesis protein
MKKVIYKFKKIDAFATEISDGNPAGTVWLKSIEDIKPLEMLKIAGELQGFVSEVGFIHKIEKNKYGLKYYSSTQEVNFCGHATIALMYELFKTDKELKNIDKIKIVTADGELIVENRIKEEDAVFIMSPAPKDQYKIPDLEEIVINLNISPDIINRDLPIKIFNAGLRTLLIPIKSLDSILTISPDINDLNIFCIKNDIDIIEVFTNDVSNKNNDYRVRVFAARFGYLEDPATGSGNSAFGYYLIDNNLWNKETINLEQNNKISRYNKIKLQKKTDQNGHERIIFGGGAIKRFDGEYILYTE